MPPSPTEFTINLSALLLLLLLSPKTPKTRLSFLILDNSILGNASSIVIPSLSYNICHSVLSLILLSVVSVAILPVDITILPS